MSNPVPRRRLDEFDQVAPAETDYVNGYRPGMKGIRFTISDLRATLIPVPLNGDATLSKHDADATYLKITAAEDAFAKKDAVASTFIAKSQALDLFVTKVEALQSFITQSVAADLFAPVNNPTLLGRADIADAGRLSLFRIEHTLPGTAMLGFVDVSGDGTPAPLMYANQTDGIFMRKDLSFDPGARLILRTESGRRVEISVADNDVPGEPEVKIVATPL